LTAKLRVVLTISVLIVASWVILLLSAFLIFAVVVPFSAPGSSSYLVELGYDTAKAVAGAAIFGIWFYSFYLLRDSYVRLTGSAETPSSSSSRQTPDENRKA
jgi:cytochrome c oxidase assembly factor CtaG